METDYRKRIQQLFDLIEQAFENVDPDIVECEQAMGSVTLTMADGTRCILSVQPSVRQIWLALASQGTVYHFNFDESTQRWMDDKGRNLELVSLLEDYLKKATGIDIKI